MSAYTKYTIRLCIYVYCGGKCSLNGAQIKRGNPQIEWNRGVNLACIVFSLMVFYQVDFSCFHKRLALLIHAKGLIYRFGCIQWSTFSHFSSFLCLRSFYNHHHHHYLFPLNRWGFRSRSVRQYSIVNELYELWCMKRMKIGWGAIWCEMNKTRLV